MDIYKKLSAIQVALKAPKGQRNKFGNYNYRSCEDILEAVKPLLSKHELFLIMGDETQVVGDILLVSSKVTLSDGVNHVETSAQAGIDVKRKGMDYAQSFGASSSYARKYALNGLFCIDDTKDSDAINTHGKEKDVKPKKSTPAKTYNQIGKIIEGLNIETPMATESQKKAIFAIVKSIGMSDTFAKESIKKVCGKNSTTELTISDASEVIAHFKSIQEAK
jgi:hypothetical protein